MGFGDQKALGCAIPGRARAYIEPEHYPSNKINRVLLVVQWCVLSLIIYGWMDTMV